MQEIWKKRRVICDNSVIYKLICRFKNLLILVIITPFIIGLVFFFVALYVDPDKLGNENELTQARNNVVQITAQILVGLSLLYGGYLGWQRLEVSREDQINDRFTKATEQLGSKSREIRLSGIYALERLAKDSPKDQETVVDILAAYFRERALIKENNIDESIASEEVAAKSIDTEQKFLSTDMQAILTILGRRKWAAEKRVDLSRVDLCKIFRYCPGLNHCVENEGMTQSGTMF